MDEAMNNNGEAFDEVEDDDECLEGSAAAAAQKGKANRSKRGPQFTAMEELMVCKAYIKASEDSIHGSKQKIALFRTQLLIAYNAIKKDQEEDDARNAAKPSHLIPGGCNVSVATVAYPECTGSSLHQLFSKKISPAVIKYMAVVRQVCQFACLSMFHALLLLLLTVHFFLQQNSIKSGEDDATWHAGLGRVYKEKYGEEFRFLPCYFFLRNKPKFLTLITDGGDGGSHEDAPKKRSIGAKDERPLGNKRAKQLKKIDDIAEHIGTKLGVVVKKESAQGDSHPGADNVTRGILGKALDEFAFMARSGLASWQQSMLLQHASDSVKRELADAQLKLEISRLKKESLEHDATDVLMNLTTPGGAAHSSTSSLSLPD